MTLTERAQQSARIAPARDGGLWGRVERHPRRVLAVIVVGAVLLQLPFLDIPLFNDEGGFLFVADQWGLDSRQVYGDQWVDRPPLLLIIFKIVDLLGGTTLTVRLVAIAFTAITILCAWWAGHTINRTRGAVIAALIATGVTTSYWLAGYQLTGEKIGGAFVLVSCALTLEAWRGEHSQRSAVLAAYGAGAAASCAFLVKQNFIDAAIFATVLMLLHVRTHWRLLAPGGIGILTPLALTAWWAESPWGPGLGTLWDAVVTFRREATVLLSTSGSTASEERETELVVLALVSGVAVIVVCFVVEALQLRGQWRLSTAIAVMLAYSGLAVYLGGSFWAHYLLGLVPPLALAAAFASCTSKPRFAVHWVAGLVVACAAAATVGGLVRIHDEGMPRRDDEVIARWLKNASTPADTVFIAYGGPDLIRTSGLGTTYPYSWSLPIRVRDPELTHLTSLLATPEAPTWLVESGDFDWWGLDTPEFKRMREVRYSVVGYICGKEIYLRVDEARELPPLPLCE